MEDHSYQSTRKTRRQENTPIGNLNEIIKR